MMMISHYTPASTSQGEILLLSLQTADLIAMIVHCLLAQEIVIPLELHWKALTITLLWLIGVEWQ